MVRRPLRLWPGVAAAVFVCIARYVVPLFVADAVLFGLLGSLIGALVIAVWWMFFSRAPWAERLGAVAVTIAAILGTRPFLHASIATGMMGMMFVMYAVPPVLAPAFVVWAVAARGFSAGVRRVSLVVTVLLACGVWTLVRTDGILGSAGAQLAWRWTQTPEEKLLAQIHDEPVAPRPAPAVVENPDRPNESSPPAAMESNADLRAKSEARESATAAGAAPAVSAATAPAALAPKRADWPGFRGPDRDGVVHGVRIETDWSASPPSQLWRRPIGPGWSSFAVDGDLLYTQEQRGDDEVVGCYRVSTGEPVWRHRDTTRFWESNGGAGPRATPTISNGRVYTFGATGILNALDAASGTSIWTRNVATDTQVHVPMWGFASSPLVIGDLVIVAAAGRLAAYDLATGHPRWSGPDDGASYSSPHASTIDGVPQVVLLSAAGARSLLPASGALLWDYSWPGGTTIVQPASLGGGDLLISTTAATGGVGMRRLSVAHAGDRWSAAARWTSIGLKPYFNDYVVHDGHAFGFDGNILSCIDLADGTRKWKGGRYGNGQLVLLAEQDLLLVLSEEGELALVSATPAGFSEIARTPALDGKTWNHPVVVRDILLVRNGQEMAAFRLPRAAR